MNAIVSTTRLPLDHVLSGALFATITLGGKDYAARARGEISNKALAVNLAKSALQGGIAAGAAIAASNKIVTKNYLSAAVYVAGGVAAVMMDEKFLNKGAK